MRDGKRTTTWVKAWYHMGLMARTQAAIKCEESKADHSTLARLQHSRAITTLSRESVVIVFWLMIWCVMQLQYRHLPYTRVCPSLGQDVGVNC